MKLRFAYILFENVDFENSHMNQNESIESILKSFLSDHTAYVVYHEKSYNYEYCYANVMGHYDILFVEKSVDNDKTLKELENTLKKYEGCVIVIYDYLTKYYDDIRDVATFMQLPDKRLKFFSTNGELSTTLQFQQLLRSITDEDIESKSSDDFVIQQRDIKT